ncbi:MAG: hypothetical protein GY833_23955 [Aestuariibacter sp.]|nr:hypothetical protein [Aestuariibacter sp.]
MAVPVQAGTPVVIGFGDLSFSAYIAEDGLSWKPGAYDTTEIIKDQAGATRAKIRMDKYSELSGSFVIDDTAGTVTIANSVPDEGDVFSITDPSDIGTGAHYYEVVDANVALAAGAAKLTMTLRKEVSMSYTPA